MCADSTTLGNRFWSKVDKTANGCWVWTAGKNAYGYGSFRVTTSPGQSFAAQSHRLAYEELVGPIPDGLTLDHTCRNRACVNPAHLEPIGRGENVLRGESSSAMHARGERCGKCASCLNATKTHCKRGHALDGDNLRIYIHGRRTMRGCVACNTIRARERRARIRGAG